MPEANKEIVRALAEAGNGNDPGCVGRRGRSRGFWGRVLRARLARALSAAGIKIANCLPRSWAA